MFILYPIIILIYRSGGQANQISVISSGLLLLNANHHISSYFIKSTSSQNLLPIIYQGKCLIAMYIYCVFCN